MKGSESKLTGKEAELASEIVAQTYGEILGGNKDFVDRYTNPENHKITEKILKAIGNIKDALSRMKSKEALTEYARVKEAENALLNALAEKGYIWRAGKILAAAEEKDKGKAAEAVDSEDGVRYNRDGDKDDLYTSSDEFIRDVLPADRSAFSRGLSNKTNDMSNDETRTVTIYCGSGVYVFNADGYMQGEMIRHFSANNSKELKTRLEKIYESIEIGRDTDYRAEIARLGFGRYDNNDFTVEDTGKQNSNDRIYAEEREGDITRNYERSNEDLQAEREKVDEIVKRLREMYVDNWEPDTGFVESSDLRFSRVTPEQDRAYMQAVEKGDMKTAQKMVDKAAKAIEKSPQMGAFFQKQT